MPRIPMPKTGDPMKRALNEVEMSELIETARKSSRRDLAIVLTLTDTGVNSTAGEV